MDTRQQISPSLKKALQEEDTHAVNEAMNQLNAFIINPDNINTDWVQLGGEIRDFINCVSQQTTRYLKHLVADEIREQEKPLADYSGGNSVTHDNSGRKLSAEEKEKIKNAIFKDKNPTIADQIVKLPAYEQLAKHLSTIVNHRENRQKCLLACSDLKTACETAKKKSEAENLLLVEAGMELYNRATKLLTAKRQDKMAHADVPLLTQCMEGAARLVNEPNGHNNITKRSNYHQHKHNVQEIFKKGLDKKGWKAVGGAMLALAGVAIMALSITIAIATYGVATPASLAGLSLGGSMAASAIGISALGFSGLSLASAGGYFANRRGKGQLGIAAEHLQKAAKPFKPR